MSLPPHGFSAHAAAAAFVPLVGAAVAAVAVAQLRRRECQRVVLDLDAERTPYGTTPRLKDQWSVLLACKEGFRGEFRKYTRCSPETFDALVKRVSASSQYEARSRPGPRGRGAKHKYSVANEVALALYVLSGCETYDRVASRWGVGGKAVVHTIMRRFIFAVCEMEREEIVWPSAPDRISSLQAEFESLKGLPFCFGAIDGAHIEIACPKECSGDYICRKLRYSVQLQAIVDANCNFMSVFAGWPGRSNDARVYHRSGVAALIEASAHDSNGVWRGYVVGDSAYPRSHFLLLGYEYGATNCDERVCSAYIDNARVVVEHSFGRLKNRFRSLRYLNCATDLTGHWILCCCILHNFIQRHDDDGACSFPDRDGDEEHEELTRPEIHTGSNPHLARGKALLVRLKDHIKLMRSWRRRRAQTVS